MASLPGCAVKGRNFTAEELIGRRISVIETIGNAAMVLADDEMVGNVSKFVLTVAQNNVTEAVLTLCHPDQPVEEILLRDYIVASFTAIASEVQ